MNDDLKSSFHKIQQKWLFFKVAEITLLAACVCSFAALLLRFFPVLSEWMVMIIIFLYIITSVALSLKFNLFRINYHEIARFLNMHFPELENSAELLLKEDKTLSPVAYIQKQKVTKKFHEVIPLVNINHKLPRALLACSLVVVIWFLLPHKETLIYSNKPEKKISTVNSNRQDTELKEILPPEIEEVAIEIYPPAYTNRRMITSDILNIKALENSRIQWQIDFTDSITNAYIVFDNGDTLSLRKNKKSYGTSTRIKKNGFYHIAFVNKNNDTLQTDFHAINVKFDQPPSVTIKSPEQHLDIEFNSNKNNLSLFVEAADDYGISAAHIVATVSRGSGEAVKFREQKINFKDKIEGTPRTARLDKLIDLNTLNMAPGDELYYYVVVSDNKKPSSQTSRTETYFLTIPDTVKNEITVEAGLGVDQMPEYFRSQRQIIIDTEKLIKNQFTLARKEYQRKLNDLGIDQKLLRLRYGQFLGEEFESGITEDIETLIEAGNEEKHDHEDEEHHHEEQQGSSTESDLLESYMHIHDYQGEATFFDDAIKAQLKAALSEMWEAELRLRTFRPKEALPYEYRALELIKEIQQKSRVYVERMGFDPPVLKPQENRLTGDLSEIQSQRQVSQLKKESQFPEMEAALKEVNSILQDNTKKLVYDKSLIGKAGQELAGLAIKEPGRYLKALASFRILSNETVSELEKKQHLEIIKKAMYTALPPLEKSPYKRKNSQTELEKIFHMEISKQQEL